MATTWQKYASSGPLGHAGTIPDGGTDTGDLNDGDVSTRADSSSATFPEHKAAGFILFDEPIRLQSVWASLKCFQDSGGGTGAWAIQYATEAAPTTWVTLSNGPLGIDTAPDYDDPLAIAQNVSASGGGVLAIAVRVYATLVGAAEGGVGVAELTAFRAGEDGCTAPPTPTNLVSSGVCEFGWQTLHWTTSPGASGYAASIDGQGEIDLGNVTSYKFGPFTIGQEYEVRIRAYNACGTSAWTSPLAFTPCIPCGFNDIVTDDELRHVEARLYNAAGLRVFLDPGAVASITWSFVGAGGMDQAHLVFQKDFNPAIDYGGLTLKIWVQGESVPRWIGIVQQPEQSLDLRESRKLAAYGRMEDMNAVLTDMILLYPGGTDLSYFVTRVLDDYEKRRGRAFARDIQTVGLDLERLEATGSSVRDAIDQIVQSGAGQIVWGWDIDPVGGVERFFLRKRLAAVRHQYFVGDRVRMLHWPVEYQGIFNAVLIKGGPARAPQLFTNPGFEVPTPPSDSSGNLLLKGGFEESGDWTYLSGASRKQQTGGDQAAVAHGGQYYLELDHNGEEARQDVAVDPLVTYRLELFQRREKGSYASAGEAIVEGRAGGVVVETYTRSLAPSSTTWSGGQGTTVASGDGVSLTVNFQDPSIDTARIRLRATNGNTTEGLLIDDVTFAPVGGVGQYGWTTHVQRPGDSDNVIYWVDWANEEAAFEGRYGVRLKVKCDTDNRTYLCPSPADNPRAPGFYPRVTPEQTLHYAARVRMAPGGVNAADGLARLELREYKSDGGQSAFTAGSSITIPNDGTWVELQMERTADSETASGFPQVAFEEDGVYDVDAFSLRDASADAPGATTYDFLRGTQFERYVTAEQVCTPGSDAAESVNQEWGRRETTLQNADIIAWTSASEAILKAWFEQHAVPLKRPRLEVLHDISHSPDPTTGYKLRVSGLKEGTIETLWPDKAEYIWGDSRLSIRVDLTRERPSLAKYLRRRSASASGGGASVTSTAATSRSQNPGNPSAGGIVGITLKNDGASVTDGTNVNTLNILGSLTVSATDNGDGTSTGSIGLGPTLEGLEAISSSAGLVEQTSTPDTFAIRSIGVGSGSSIPDRDAADSRYVRSVGVSVPAALLTVSGTPVTSTGTIAIALASQAARTALLGPASGPDAAPAFRLIKANDLESLAGGVLFGRYDGSAGAGQEITIGSGLTLDSGTGVLSNTGAGSGTVTSVGLAAPAEFSISGSPVTTSGTLTLAKANQSANTVWAGPTGGGAAAPAFRALVAADIPALAYVTSVAMSVPSILSLAGSPITSSGTLALSLANQSGNTVFASPSNGSSGTPAFRSLVAADIPSLSYVTSVGLSLPGIFSVSGSPVTSSGTLTATLASQSANRVWASPNGSAGAPTFRALVAADIPALPYVSSVALSAPAEISVSGSPVTSSGTLALSWANQTQNKVFASPNGSTGTPAFRALVAGDIPALAYVTSVALSAPSFLSVSGSPVTSSGTLALSLASQSANLFFAGPASGSAAAPTFRSMVPADLPQLITPAQLTADQHDYAPTGHATALGMILESDAQRTITGFAGGVDKRPLLIVNRGLYNIILADDSSGSSAANRIALPSALTLVPSSGTWLVYDGTAQRWILASPWFTEQYTGTVTSVGLSLPAIFSVSGSPVTGSGTLTATLASQSANTVFAAPNGSAGAPTFRALVAADIPALSYVTSVGLSAPAELSVGGSPVTSSGTLALTWANQTQNKVFASPSGSTGTPAFRALVAADIPSLAYVTSVGLSLPAEFSVSGSPVTSSGTLTATKANQSANTVWAGPTNGAAAAPAFRSLVASDIPALSYVTSVALSAPAIFSVSGSPVTSSGTLTLSLATQVANRVWAGPSSGADANPTFRALVSDDIPSLSIAKIAAAAGSRIFGRYAGTSGAGQEITIGAGLTLDSGTGALTATGSGGTVTSVGLSLPAIFSVSGSPVTTSGTLTATLASQSANRVWAAPDGSAGAPTFRALVAADIPSLAYVTSVALSAPAEFSVSGSPVTSSGTLTFTKASQSANRVWASPDGSAGAPTFRALVAADIPSLAYVTSVGLSLPAIFSVSGSPVTSSGTLTATLANQSGNVVFASPSNGSSGAPAFRALVAADLPQHAISKIDSAAGARLFGRYAATAGAGQEITIGTGLSLDSGTGALSATATGTVTSVALSAPAIFSVSGSPVTSSGTLTLSLASQSANLVWASPNGSAGAPTFRALVVGDLANDLVTYAKIQNVSVTDRLLGRDTTGAGDIEELSVSGGLEFTGSGGIQRSALTGDVTASAGSNATTIPNDTVTFAKIQNITDARLLGRSAGSDGDMQHITVASPLTLSSGALGFDQTVALGNVARTTVRKNTGADVGSRRRLNFTEGSNITLTITDDAPNEEIDITIAASGGGSGYATIQNEGSSLTQRAIFNFIGQNVDAADNAGSSRTDVTIISPFNLERPTTATTDFTKEKIVVFEDTGGGTSYDFTAQGVYHVVNRRSAADITVGAAGSFTLVGGSLTLKPGQDCRVVAFSYGGAGNVAYRLDDTPGGSDGHIQYKKGAGSAGESGFSYDDSTNQATVPGLTLTEDLAFTGDISPSQITADQNDYNPTSLATSVVLRLTSDASRTLTGLQGGSDGRLLLLRNVGSHTIWLADQSTASSAANRFDLGFASTPLFPGSTIALQYDATDSRWKLLVNTLPPLANPLLNISRFWTLEEDFNNGVTALADGLGSSTTGTGAAGTATAGESGAFGVLQSQTGSTTTGRHCLNTGGSSILLGGALVVWTARVRLQALSDGTDTFTDRLGLGDSTTAEFTDGVYFRYTHGTNSGNWQCVCRSNSNETGSIINTSTAPVTSGWQVLQLVVNPAASSVEFFINGTSQGTVTTNIPTGTGRELGVIHQHLKSAGTTDRILYTDYIRAYAVFTTAR